MLLLALGVAITTSARPLRNTPPYRVGCFNKSPRTFVNIETNYRISAQYTTCCYYVDGEQLYGCDTKTSYYDDEAAFERDRPVFRTISTALRFADMPYQAVEYLDIIHGFTAQLRDALYHVTRGLNEMYACTTSAGANCTAQLNTPFALFTEEPCYEDDDDDGSIVRDANDDYNDIRCPTLAHRARIPGLFTTVIPDYTALTGRVLDVDFTPARPSTTFQPEGELDFQIYMRARLNRGRVFKRNDRLPPNIVEFIELVTNYAQLARETNETKLRSLFSRIRAHTAPFNYEYRRPLVSMTFESEKTQYRYEDLVRFGRRIIDDVAHPGLDRTVSCLERFYFGDADPLGSAEVYRVRSLLVNLDRLTMMVDDDDGSGDDHFGMQTKHCYAGREVDYRARAYQNYTVDVQGKRVCHPWENDPKCEEKYGSNHRSSDVSACVRRAYTAMQPLAEKITLALQYIVQSLHSRLAKIQEVLRISREVGSPTYRFPNNTQCFQNPFFKTSTHN